MEYYSSIKRNGVPIYVIKWLNLENIMLSELWVKRLVLLEMVQMQIQIRLTGIIVFIHLLHTFIFPEHVCTPEAIRFKIFFFLHIILYYHFDLISDLKYYSCKSTILK